MIQWLIFPILSTNKHICRYLSNKGGNLLNNVKEDRRIRRTQRLLKESLAELMSEKSFNNITIKDITEKADLNRGTFYLHYTDTYGLLKAMEDDMLKDFQEMIDNYLHMGPPTDLMPVLSPVIHYIVENRDICINLFENSASSDFQLSFKNLIHRNSLALAEQIYPSCRSDSFDYFFEFAICGAIGIIRKWLASDMEETEETIARISNDAVLSVARSFFGPPKVALP